MTQHTFTHPTATAWCLEPKAWETEFFGRTFASLSVVQRTGVSTAGDDVAALRDVVATADADGIELLECHLEMSDSDLAASLEEVGFRLVDSRIRFLTRMTMSEIPEVDLRWGQVTDAEPDHLERIVELTHQCFTDNPAFTSRYKNSAYFTPTESRRWFEAWVRNTSLAADARTAVFTVDDDVAGFYIYLRSGDADGIPVLKGILTGVAPAARGANAQLAMQAHLYRGLGFDEWYLDNLTQLSNLPVIRNHVRSAKRLESIQLTFYRRAVDPRLGTTTWGAQPSRRRAGMPM